MTHAAWLIDLSWLFELSQGCFVHLTRNQRTVRSFQFALAFRIKCSRMSLNKYAFYTSRKLLETAWSACFEVKNHENYFANEFWLTTNKTPAVESINMVPHWLPISRWPPPAVVSRHKPQLRIKSHKWLANQNREDAESDFYLNVTPSAWMRQIGKDSRVVQGQFGTVPNQTNSTDYIMVGQKGHFRSIVWRKHLTEDNATRLSWIEWIIRVLLNEGLSLLSHLSFFSNIKRSLLRVQVRIGQFKSRSNMFWHFWSCSIKFETISEFFQTLYAPKNWLIAFKNLKIFWKSRTDKFLDFGFLNFEWKRFSDDDMFDCFLNKNFAAFNQN